MTVSLFSLPYLTTLSSYLYHAVGAIFHLKPYRSMDVQKEQGVLKIAFQFLIEVTAAREFGCLDETSTLGTS
jgi:hypothetical protein